MEGPNYETAVIDHEELFYNKEKLLANGDRWEPQLARNIETQIRNFWSVIIWKIYDLILIANNAE